MLDRAEQYTRQLSEEWASASWPSEAVTPRNAERAAVSYSDWLGDRNLCLGIERPHSEQMADEPTG